MKAVVVEDSRIAREGLIAMLADYTDVELIGSADHPDTALALLEENRADVLFLDIHMPGRSGFDLVESLNYSPCIIFTTAYSEYAIRSFDFNTVDYLLKPISRDRLDQAITKLREHFALASAQGSGLPGQNSTDNQLLDINSRMFIQDNEQCYLVDLSSIRYFESCKNYARLYFDESNAFIKISLNQLEKRLPPAQFMRANRQYIVNLRAVTSIDEAVKDGYCLRFNDGKEVEVSRRSLVRLKELLSF